MKKFILLTLTALTLMACDDNGVSEPSNNNNNGNCVDVIVGYNDVATGDYTDYYSEWQKQACNKWDDGICVGVNTAAKVPVKYCY